MANSLPTIPQMKARMLSGHVKALAAINEGGDPFDGMLRSYEVQGMRTVLSTLIRWAVIESEWLSSEKRSRYELTERGKALLGKN